MIKIIIAASILLIFPVLSNADMAIYEGTSIGANASVDNEVESESTNIVNNTTEASNQDDVSTDSTSTTELEVEDDGFFSRIINWFKGWFN